MITVGKENFFSHVSIGAFASETPWIHPARIIDSFELILVTEGTIYIEEEDVQYVLKQNQMLILEPGKLHRGYRTSTGKTAFYLFHYRTDLPLPFKTYGGTDFYEVKYGLKKLLHIANTLSYSDAARDAAALIVYEEAAKISREEFSLHPIIGKVAEYIRVNIRNNPTVAAVAHAYGYAPDYISKIFKSARGISIKTYITKLKMNLAKDYLLTTEFTVKQIASELGFPDENLFIKFFLYHEKISPTKYRNRFFNTHMNNK